MKRLLLAFTAVLFFALALSSCKKDETNNVNNNGNTENPGGGSGGGNYNNQEYPSTANVIRRAVTDIDGNCYDAVQIGNQVWMAENLRTTRYANGDFIPVGSSSSEYEPFRYIPGNNTELVATRGYLYNFEAAVHGEDNDGTSGIVQGVCPNGWHLPSGEEVSQLIAYMGSQNMYIAGGNPTHIAKALAAASGWASSTVSDAVGNYQAQNNASGFTAIPLFNEDEETDQQGGFYAFFWGDKSHVNSEDHHRRGAGYYIAYDDPELDYGYFMARERVNVRCVRD